MIKKYPAKKIDLCLITTSDVTLGARSLSAFMKENGYAVTMGFFSKWGLYTPEEVAGVTAWIRETDPVIVGISSIEFSRERALQLMAAVKAIGKTIVAGGPDPTGDPESYLGHADYVIRGESEHALAELAEALRAGKDTGGIANLCYKKNDGTPAINPVRPFIGDLDEIPFEDWLDIEHHYELRDGAVARKLNYPVPHLTYHLGNHTATNVFLMTMRGCAFECSFCVNSLVRQMYPHGKLVRKKSIPLVIDRVEQILRAGTPIDMFWFQEDDFFLRTPEEIREFAAAWKQRIKAPFTVHCSPTTVTEEKLSALVDAGMVFVETGIQTGSERTNRAVYGRPMGAADVLRMAALLHRYIGRGSAPFLPPIYDFIMNNPYETEADLLETVALFRKLPKPYHANLLSLKFFQGTALYGKAKRDGLVAGKDAATKFDCHDMLNNAELLIRRGGHYYLNSLLAWMKGFHTRRLCAYLPWPLVGVLTSRPSTAFFDRNRRLVDALNAVRPSLVRFLDLRIPIIEGIRRFVRTRRGTVRSDDGNALPIGIDYRRLPDSDQRN